MCHTNALVRVRVVSEVDTSTEPVGTRLVTSLGVPATSLVTTLDLGQILPLSLTQLPATIQPRGTDIRPVVKSRACH